MIMRADQAPPDVLWLAPGEVPPTPFPNEAEAEAAIQRTMASRPASSLLADRASYDIRDEPERFTRRAGRRSESTA